MNPQSAILFALGGRRDRDVYLRGLDIRFFPGDGPESWIRDRVRFLVDTVVAPMKQSWRVHAVGRSLTAALEHSRNDKKKEYVEYFMEHNVGEPFQFVGFWHTRGVAGLGGLARRAGWYGLAVIVALAALFDFSKRRYYWMGAVLLNVMAVAGVAAELERLYVFNMYNRTAYVVAAYAHAHTGIEVRPVISNILYVCNRSMHLRVPVLLTSRVAVEEARYFRETGDFLATEVESVGSLYMMDSSDWDEHEPKYDIGFVSSGEWAREEGRARTVDIDGIVRGDYADNPYAEKAREILDYLVDYSREHGLTLGVFLHPHERRLWHEFGVTPPFASLANIPTVTIESDEGNSRASYGDANTMVAIQSSYIWERLDLGLESSYIFRFSDPELNPYLFESLGRYQENTFSDAQELGEKLSRALAVDGPGRA